MPILVIGLVSQVAIGLVGAANEVFDLKTDSSIQVILIVVLFGIGTDYILFFLFRYRERLRAGEEQPDGGRAGGRPRRRGDRLGRRCRDRLVHGADPQLARHLQVDRPGAGDRGRRHGPGRADPGPGRGRPCSAPGSSGRRRPGRWSRSSARFARVGRSLGRRPAVFAATSGLMLAVLALFALGFNPNFDLGDSGAPEDVESAVALRTLQKGFPPGSTDPTVDPAHLDRRQAARPGRDHRVRRRRSARRRASRRWRRPSRARTADRRRSTSSSTRTRPPTRRWPTSRARSATPRTRRPDGHRGLGRRHDVGLRGLPEGDEPRLRGGVPGRGDRDHDDPGPAAPQPGRAVVPDGIGRPRLRRHARRRRARLPAHPGQARA